MKFDPPLAKAELNRASLLLFHHIRQIEIDGDMETAEYFHTTLRRLAKQSAVTVRECEIKRCAACDELVRRFPHKTRGALHGEHLFVMQK